MWIPVAAAAAVIVVVLGGLGIWWLATPDSSSTNGMGDTTTTTGTTTETTTRTTTRTTATSSAPLDSKLIGLLPSGYSSGACEPANPPATDALATVDCAKTDTPGGPTSARYSLYPDGDTLAKHFKAAIGADSELVQCPGSGVDSPTSWHYNATPNDVAGSIACGTYKGNPDVVWTKDSDLVLGDAQATNLADLHQWWLKYA
jgi:serine/threonine-protein kinase